MEKIFSSSDAVDAVDAVPDDDASGDAVIQPTPVDSIGPGVSGGAGKRRRKRGGSRRKTRSKKGGSRKKRRTRKTKKSRKSKKSKRRATNKKGGGSGAHYNVGTDIVETSHGAETGRLSAYNVLSQS